MQSQSFDDYWGTADTRYLIRVYQDVMSRANADGSLNHANRDEFEYQTARYILQFANISAGDPKSLADCVLDHVRSALADRSSTRVSWA